MRANRQENIVLIADDDQFVRDVVKQIVGSFCECTEITDGAGVVDAYKNCFPDLLFLDMHLPVISGLDLVPQIMAVDNDAYIIMLTGDSTAENVRNAVKAGAKGFIGKPFDRKTLLANLRRCPTIKIV